MLLKILKKRRYHYFIPVYQESGWYDQIEIGNFGTFLASLIPLKTRKIRILKKWKNCWRHHFAHVVFQKLQSYEVPFLRYRMRQTEFFVVLDHFLPLHHPNNPENQNFEKVKRHLQMESFYTCVPKITIVWCVLHEMWSAISIHFFSAIFCPFTPLTTRKIKIWKKWKKHLEILSFYTWVP